MRLTAFQIDAIERATTEVFGEGSDVWLFGSRIDDGKRGGDLDLLIRPPERALEQTPEGMSVRDGKTVLMEKIRLLGALERRLGNRRIDIVIEMPGDTRPIVRIAREQGIRLNRMNSA